MGEWKVGCIESWALELIDDLKLADVIQQHASAQRSRGAKRETRVLVWSKCADQMSHTGG